MKKLFALLPMIWLILGAIAIATEIKAPNAVLEPTPTIIMQTAVFTAVFANYDGYLAASMLSESSQK